MSVRNLEYLLRPRSVAIVGASNRPRSIGATVMRNLIEAGFKGPIYPVNPKHDTVAGRPAVADVSKLPAPVDVAVICTPPETVPRIISALGQGGTKAAIVLTAGLAGIRTARGETVQQAMLDAAKPHLLRILGPNCVGLLVPGIGLNASFAHTSALVGELAFVSQSGALTTAVLDWAKSRGIGFSHFVSVGDRADVDFADLLDYLASDPGTRAILLYIESIRTARKFMSAARAAARNKPVIVVKVGRSPEGAKAAASHTGALVGRDDVFDAAIRRAGMLRVDTTAELFGAVETLARARPVRGDRLTVVTNGGGPGVMATDAVTRGGASLAQLSEVTLGRLAAVLPRTWSHGNPVDIIGDAPPERYVDALRIALDDPQSDAVLVVHAPTAIVPSDEIATACIDVLKAADTTVLACWLGGDAVATARDIFAAAGVPNYDTPEGAVQAFLQLVEYHRNQAMLLEVPAAVDQDFRPDIPAARQVVAQVLADARDLLSAPEANAVLAAYGIPVVDTRVTKNPAAAAEAGEALGFPVALKVLSPEVSHKSDVGGVVLDLRSADAVREAAEQMIQRMARLRPAATIDGFTVQRMVSRSDGQAANYGPHELIVGVATDPVFGPVIVFGEGGTAVEVTRDHAVALPPLNMTLARELISRTRVAARLAGYRDRPAADPGAVCTALLRLSDLVKDIPEIIEVDVNPLLADDAGVVALDARIRVERATRPGDERLAIRPYPNELEESIRLDGRSVLLRPVRPEDRPQLEALFDRTETADMQLRFFCNRRQLPCHDLARYSQIDYDREMAFVALAQDERGEIEMLGDVRAVADPDNLRAAFGVLVRSDVKGKGLGLALLAKLIRYFRGRGTKELVGEVIATNTRMRELARDIGCAVGPSGDPTTVTVRFDLQRNDSLAGPCSLRSPISNFS